MNKVLLIDDDRELCALMKKCVEQGGLLAVVANSGCEGLRMALENRDEYALIILDRVLFQ